jgi:C-methyltransferase.
LFTPIYNIPILSKKEGYKKKIDYLLILAVNYADMIIKKEKEFGKKGGKFIVPRGETIQYL